MVQRRASLRSASKRLTSGERVNTTLRPRPYSPFSTDASAAGKRLRKEGLNALAQLYASASVVRLSERLSAANWWWRASSLRFSALLVEKWRRVFREVLENQV